MEGMVLFPCLFDLILYIPVNNFQVCGTDPPGSNQYLGLNEVYVWFLLPTYPNFLTLP